MSLRFLFSFLFLTPCLQCNRPFSLAVRKDSMAPPLSILTHLCMSFNALWMKQTLWKRIWYAGPNTKRSDNVCDTRWGANKMLNIVEVVEDMGQSNAFIWAGCVCFWQEAGKDKKKILKVDKSLSIKSHHLSAEVKTSWFWYPSSRICLITSAREIQLPGSF